MTCRCNAACPGMALQMPAQKTAPRAQNKVTDFDAVMQYEDANVLPLCRFFARLSDLEEQITRTAFFTVYEDGIGKRWRSLVNRGHRFLLELTHITDALKLAEEFHIPPLVCYRATVEVSGVEVEDWLMDNAEQWMAWFKHQTTIAVSMSKETLANQAIHGDYDTSLGGIDFQRAGFWTGRTASAKFRPNEGGVCSGLLTTSVFGTYRFRGSSSHGSQQGKAAIAFRFNRKCDGFEGKSWYGDVRNKWFSARELDEDDEGRLGLSGLRNLGNTCYQNSVLQVLWRGRFVSWCLIRSRRQCGARETRMGGVELRLNAAWVRRFHVIVLVTGARARRCSLRTPSVEKSSVGTCPRL